MDRTHRTTVYRVATSLTIDDLPVVQEAWQALVADAPETIAVDLQAVTAIDGAGWQLIHSLVNSCIHAAIKLELVGISEELREQAAQFGFGPPLVS